MNEQLKEFDYSNTNDQISLIELVKELWKKKLIILLFSIFCGVTSGGASMFFPDVYESKVLLSTSNSSSSGSAALGGQLGSLASLAGVSLGGGEGDKVSLAMELLYSRAFLVELIEKYNLAVPFFAVLDWNEEENKFVYDLDSFDPSSGNWTDAKSTPSSLDIYDKILKSHLKIEKKADGGFVTLSIKHVSPHVAKKTVDAIVFEINDKIRKMDIDSASKSVVYLERAIQETQIDDMRKVLFKLMEKEFQKKMLAEIQVDYVFQTIDPAIEAPYPKWPKRILIVFVSFILGFVLSCSAVLIIYSFKREGV